MIRIISWCWWCKLKRQLDAWWSGLCADVQYAHIHKGHAGPCKRGVECGGKRQVQRQLPATWLDCVIKGTRCAPNCSPWPPTARPLLARKPPRWRQTGVFLHANSQKSRLLGAGARGGFKAPTRPHPHFPEPDNILPAIQAFTRRHNPRSSSRLQPSRRATWTSKNRVWSFRSVE